MKYDNGKKVKELRITTKKDGKFTLFLGTRIKVGTYKLTFTSDNWGLIDKVKYTLKIKKGKADVKAPKVTAKHKKSKYFKVYVKHRQDETLYKIKMKVKVYTGKKAKTYNLKTNLDGVAKINTKKLSKGTHKVVIKSTDDNYKFSLKSKIKIK